MPPKLSVISRRGLVDILVLVKGTGPATATEFVCAALVTAELNCKTGFVVHFVVQRGNHSKNHRNAEYFQQLQGALYSLVRVASSHRQGSPQRDETIDCISPAKPVVHGRLSESLLTWTRIL